MRKDTKLCGTGEPSSSAGDSSPGESPSTNDHQFREQLDRVYQDGRAALQRFASARVEEIKDAEDIVQEAYLKVLHHRPGCASDLEFRKYLFTVVAHLIFDRARHEGVHSRLKHKMSAPEAYQTDFLFATMLHQSEQHLPDWFAELPIEVQIAWNQRCSGMELDSIAIELGVSRTTVSNYIATVIAHCQQHIEKGMPGSSSTRRRSS